MFRVPGAPSQFGRKWTGRDGKGRLRGDQEETCFLGSANRDERHFVDPDRFDLHRPESDPKRAFTGAAEHLAFGGGRHFCLGAVLSRFEIEVALTRIFEALPDLRLAGESPPDVGLFLRGPATLPVRFSTPAPASRRETTAGGGRAERRD